MLRIGRRLGVTAAVFALALGIGAVPASAGPGCTYLLETIPAQQLTFTPPHTAGDRDFAGHGPTVAVNTFLTAWPGFDHVTIQILMTAEEGRPDWTSAAGRSVRRIHSLRQGWVIDRLVTPDGSHLTDSLHYTDTDHGPEYFSPSDPLSFVAGYRAVGDTIGDESGTKTQVRLTTKPIRISTEHC